ncbi:MAG: 4'-phosphopantetheinyl transferase superfamily protein [Actinomycetota bacterium]|nr:4'-phosphopantetheinyl transferase superfamily protein [Actinomycetota bacterium]
MPAPVAWPVDPLPVLEPGSWRVLAVDLTEHDHPAALREVLAGYAGTDPEAVRVEPAACVHCGEPHGKPHLAEPALDWLRFNVSHSGDLALYAVAHGREIGVDVEAHRPGRRLAGIAERRFTPAEAEHLRSLPAGEHDPAFFRLWARKEAYLKATAEGLPGLLGSFDALTPSLPEGWELADLDAGPGHSAAVVVAAPGYRPGGWRATKPLTDRGAACQREPRGPLRPLVSKRTPATTMNMWPGFE